MMILNKKNSHQKKQRRIIFVILMFFTSLAALSFIILSFKENMIFFYSPTDLKKAKIHDNKIIRVGGMIKEKTINYLPNSIIEFTITDFDNELKIRYQGLKPNLFREGQGTVAKGIFEQKQNIFIANELLTKHDEKYMPPEIAKSVMKNKTDKD